MSGNPVGDQFIANETTAGSQFGPDIAMRSDGTFVVAWVDSSNGDGSERIAARRFDATGTPLGGEFQVNVESIDTVSPQIAMQSNGDFAIFWSAYEPTSTYDTDVKMRIFDHDGVAQTGEILVNNETAGYQGIDDAIVANGRYLAVWGEIQQSGNGVLDLYGRYFDSSGQASGVQFRLDSSGPTDQFEAKIAATPDGFLAVWESEEAQYIGNDQRNVELRAFDGNGQPLGDAVRIGDYETNTQREPAITRVGDRYLAVWESDNRVEEMQGIYARWFDAAGIPQGHEFPISNCWASGDDYYAGYYAAAVASIGTEDWIVAWSGGRSPDRCDPTAEGYSHIYAQYGEPSLAKPSAKFISTYSSGKIGKLRFSNADIIRHMPGVNQWTMMFDASDLGIKVNLRDFAIQPDGSLLLAFAAKQTGVESVGTILPTNIYRYVPEYHYSFFGLPTDGELSLYFEGADVGLTTSAEHIDALAADWDGNIYISTTSTAKVPGLTAKREDLMKFTPTSLGGNTAGAWSLAFDGSDYNLKANLNSVWDDPQSDSLFMTFEQNVQLAGDKQKPATILRCDPDGQNCQWSVFWNAANHGLPSALKIDGLELPNGRQ